MAKSSRRGRTSSSGRTRGWGSFFAIDGPDGSGKSTQAKLLAEALAKQGRTVVLTRDPGGTPLGERVRKLLLEPGGPEISDRTELFLFMAARAQLVEEIIHPALEAGRTVVSDRFAMSSTVYQGLAGTVPAGEVEVIGRSATIGTQPDLTNRKTRLLLPLNTLDIVVGVTVFVVGALILSPLLFKLKLRDEPH